MKKLMLIGFLVLIVGSVGLCEGDNPYVGNWKGVISFGMAPANSYSFKILYLKTNEYGKSEGAVLSQDSSDSPATILRIDGSCSRDGSFSYIFFNARGVPTYCIQGNLNNMTDNVSGLFYWKLFTSKKVESQGAINLTKA